jgi:superfamily II DNA/RNA helicase
LSVSPLPVDAPGAPSGPSFAEMGLPRALVNSLAAQGITEPLPIQTATIADAMAGRDVCGKAPTGSGKTLAFALPMAARLDRAQPKRPKGLILAPTRELAAQITAEMDVLLRTKGMRAHAFYGGTGFGQQRDALRRGADVAVACPGRLEDLMARGDIRLSDVEIVVIDEADRMADMGFLPAVRRILAATAPDRQTLLFSATLDGDVDVLIRNYQTNPVRHEVDPPEDETTQASHRFHEVDRAERIDACLDLATGFDSSIIFVRTKHGADRLARQLSGRGLAAEAIHGGRSQPQRDRTLRNFRAGSVRALVATDVAARGIHVDGVSGVIHFDLPTDAKDYIHRSGRTARAGASGAVVALVTEDQRDAARDLQRQIPVAISGLSGSASHPAPAAKAPAGRSSSGRGAGGSGSAGSGGRSGRPAAPSAGRRRSRRAGRPA